MCLRLIRLKVHISIFSPLFVTVYREEYALADRNVQTDFMNVWKGCCYAGIRPLDVALSLGDGRIVDILIGGLTSWMLNLLRFLRGIGISLFFTLPTS